MRTFIWLVVLAGAVILGVVIAKHRPAPLPAATAPAVSTEESSPAPTTPATSPITSNTVTTKNGMKIETTKEGTGPAITTGQTAVVQYEGKLADGTIFDSTAKHGGQPFSFTLGENRVIQGWEQGVLGMKAGETRILTIPPELGYGPQGYPPIIPQNATLTFTVTLEAIQ